MKTKTTKLIAIAIAAAITLTSCERPAPVTTEQSAPGYPLGTCVVSGEKLGSMGEPHVIVHEGTTVKFCCKSCVKDFNEDPGKYTAKIEAAAAKP